MYIIKLYFMKKISTIILVISITVICIIFAILRVNNYILKNQNNELITQAKQASLFIDAEDVSTFRKDASDLNSDNYTNILNKLVSFRELNPEIRFLYILGYDQNLNKQFFFLDTEPVNSSEYSPPGQIFEDTRPVDIEHFLKGESYVDGPYKDSWGDWYSAYAPILDASGNTVALLGIDVSVDIWRSQTLFATITISLVGVLIAIIILSLLFSIYKKESSIEVLEKETDGFSIKEKKFKELQDLARVGKFTFYLPEKFFYFDNHLASVFNIATTTKFSLESFVDLISPDDKENFLNMMDSIANKEVKEINLNFKVSNKEGKYVKYRLSGQIKESSINRMTVSGLMQDIG